MINKNLTGQDLRLALESAKNHLQNKMEWINSLNVFPVPDGDTGSNMFATFNSGFEAIKALENVDSGTIITSFARGSLFGARGNSGVILSQIIRGFKDSWQNKNKLSIADIISGFENAVKRAYDSVVKPVEGTILTFIRKISEVIKNARIQKLSFLDLFQLMVQEGRRICDETTKELKQLENAGVTDSGSEGMLIILEGIYHFLNNNPISFVNSSQEVNFHFSGQEDHSDFGYCTEAIVNIGALADFNRKKLESKLSKRIESLVVVEQDGLLKIHGHCLKPGNLLNYLQRYGEFDKIKIESMDQQASKHIIKKTIAPKMSALISCNNGQGFINLMKERNASKVVAFDQTNKPSFLDLVNAIEQINAKSFFILPNDKNFLLVAEQVVSWFKKDKTKKIIIIPTTNQLQGQFLAENFHPDTAWKDNKSLMLQANENINVFSLFQAAKDAKLDGFEIKNEQFIALQQGKVSLVDANFLNLIKSILETHTNEHTISVYLNYGADLTEEQIVEIEKITNNYENIDFVFNKTDQEVYPLLIGIINE